MASSLGTVQVPTHELISQPDAAEPMPIHDAEHHGDPRVLKDGLDLGDFEKLTGHTRTQEKSNVKDEAVLHPFRKKFRRNRAIEPLNFSAAAIYNNPDSQDEVTSSSADTLFDHVIKVPNPAYFAEHPRQNQSDPADYVFDSSQDFHNRLNRAAQYAEKRSKSLRRPKWLQIFLQYGIYIVLLCIVYFVVVGWPLWRGIVYNFWFVYEDKLDLSAGWAIFLGISVVYAVAPLFVRFEEDPPIDEKDITANINRAEQTAVVIPSYRSQDVIGQTLAAAMQTFPAQNIFVVANGNSEEPLDNTAEVCKEYGVRHIWMPMGSKVVAQFVGVNAAFNFPFIMMMDDDCCLPSNFPVVTDRLQAGDKRGATKCVGYTIQSVGKSSSKGSLCQQAQDIEYKLSGLQRYFWGLWGSAPFAHGAISLWDRAFLLDCFRRHPGYTISEDWYFGLVSRRSGGRIQMCSQVFVPTETPQNLVLQRKGVRAGYGEMTVTKQRMMRWNFFLVSRMWYNIKYILFSWNLGIYEVGTKLEVFRETYETLLLLSTPIFLPISIGVNPGFTIGVTFAILLMYSLIVVVFNEIHLRIKGIQVSRMTVVFYYPLYKTYLRIINIVSCYVALFRYARYFRVRYPTIMENERAMRAMVKLAGEHYGDETGAPREATESHG